jgi:hypothetical protein
MKNICEAGDALDSTKYDQDARDMMTGNATDASVRDLFGAHC